MVQLHQARDEFKRIGFRVILVGQGRPAESEKFRKEFAPSYPVICDPDKALFTGYGLRRGTLTKMVSPGVIFRGIGAMSRGALPGIPRGDILQLAGVFLIDEEGTIRYFYFSKDASDYPAVETLLKLEGIVTNKGNSSSG